MTADHSERWLVQFDAAPQARRLVCVGAAGAGAGPFRPWAESLAPDVAVVAVRLPGRETRIAEPPVANLRRVVAELTDALESRTRVWPSFALFGLCSGALVAFEVARELQRRGQPPPSTLVVAAEGAPRLRAAAAALRTEVQDIWERVEALGATDPALLANQEVRELLAPALRADFAIVDEYGYVPAPKLPLPIVAIGALDDPLVPADAVEAWEEETASGFEHVTIESSHIFTGRGWMELADCVRGVLMVRDVQ
jgi:medium-chain acyl-[acyl-carrier-protein] hydrolase